MFRLLATTKCQRQQIAILIISFFAYVAGIRNEGNNMLLRQQEPLQQQLATIENSNNESPITDAKQQSTLNFRPSQILEFTPADAVVPQQQFMTTYTEAQHTINRNKAAPNILKQQKTQNDNRRHMTIEKATTHENIAERRFSFPNEQQQIPQHLTDKPIYIYRDPFTNENYHYTPAGTKIEDATIPTPTAYNHNNYNNNAYKQQNSQHNLHHNNNQEYLVQSSMTVGTHQQQEANPFRPYMSLSADKDVYLKRPGFVYDEKTDYNHPNSKIDKKRGTLVDTLKVNKISYDSHDYPPPSYFQQQTSNFLPKPVPSQTSTSRPLIRPIPPPMPAHRQGFRPPLPTQPSIFGQQRPQQQYLQTSQSTLSNYANSIDNYLLNKQQTNEYYRTEPQSQYQYENKPQSPSHLQQHQHFSQPSYNLAENPYPQYETPRPPPGRPSYNNYYDYQIGEIPPPHLLMAPPSQQFNYPYPRPPPQYPYQGSHRPPPPPQHQQQSGLATLAQYAPQFTSLFLNGVGNGVAGSNTNGPLSSLIGALTGAATSQQSSSSYSSYNKRPINSQLIKALENIAHNDDLQCVPKVLCQMIAAQTERGQLPTFITSPAISNFLAGFPAASPVLIYGRAALLGLSGGDQSCRQTYDKCPKDEYEIIDYLNNHRGGFFKFFSEPEEQSHTVNHEPTQQGATSLFSILSALTGTPQATTTTPRPTPKPAAPSSDISSGIANFFTQLLSDYMGGASVEYQRRLQRRTKRSLNDKIKFEGEKQSESESEEHHSDIIKFQDEDDDKFIFKDEDFDIEEDFHDEEDEEDTQSGVSFDNDEHKYLDNLDARILYKTVVKGKRLKFFPELTKETADEISKDDDDLKKIIQKFNDFNRERKLKFPTATDEREYTDVLHKKIRQGKKLNNELLLNKQNYGHQFNNYIQNSFEDFQNETQQVDNEEQAQTLYSNFVKTNTSFVFPARQSKILNHPHYAASYLQDYLQQENLEQHGESDLPDKFIIPNGQRPVHYIGFPSTSLANAHNIHISSVNAQNSVSSNTAVNNNIYIASSPNNHFLPTPPPLDRDYTSFNSIYSNKQNTDNQNSDITLNQSASFKQQKYPSSTSSLNGGSSNVYKPQRYNSNSQTNLNQYHSSLFTTKRPYTTFAPTTRKSDDKNIYVTNSRGVTEYFITPDGRKVYL